MSLDASKILSALGDEAVAQVGDQVGLERETALKVARALSAHIGKGKDEAVRAAAVETGLAEEVVAQMFGKLVEVGAEKVMSETPVGEAVGAAQGAVADAAGKAASGMLGRLGGMFGRK